MGERIIDIADGGGRLVLRNEQLLFERDEGPAVATPLAELGVLLVSAKAVVYTQPLLQGLARHGVVLVIGDERHMPAAIMAPLVGHHRQSERFRLQAAASKPVQKRLWQQIVTAKVALQGRVLRDFRAHDLGLVAMAERVKSGDTENTEGQAARRYWTALFDDPTFRRDREGPGPNKLLNYGYGVLRAMTARAICASGLHPSLGIHHHNRYDAFPLADDLMEPYRPLVDRAALHLVIQHGMEAPLDRDAKADIIRAVTGRYACDGEVRGMFDILQRMTASLAQVYEGERKGLVLPRI